MHYVYMLQSSKRDYIYIGSTNDLKRRFLEHNKGRISSTKQYVPFRLVYYEAYLHRIDALNREYKLKHHGSVIGHLKKRLKNSITDTIPPKGRGSIRRRPYGLQFTSLALRKLSAH